MAYTKTDCRILDFIAEHIGAPNDAALSRALDVKPPVISKIRAGRLPFGPSLILKAHEIHGIPVKEIRAHLD